MEKVKQMTNIDHLRMVRLVSAEVQLQDCSFQSQISSSECLSIRL